MREQDLSVDVPRGTILSHRCFDLDRSATGLRSLVVLEARTHARVIWKIEGRMARILAQKRPE
ncbi:MAG: hypothetical protein EBR81_14440 [Proteobacteria bacterium]|nr:hypothetical protein [Pseudomonadota bacterium]